MDVDTSASSSSASSSSSFSSSTSSSSSSSSSSASSASSSSSSASSSPPARRVLAERERGIVRGAAQAFAAVLTSNNNHNNTPRRHSTHRQSEETKAEDKKDDASLVVEVVGESRKAHPRNTIPPLPVLAPTTAMSNDDLMGEKEQTREVPPASSPASCSVRISGFQRPLNIKSLQALLAEAGPVSYFWMEKFRKFALVSYNSKEEAEACRQKFYGLRWPTPDRKPLEAEFVSESDIQTLSQEALATPHTPITKAVDKLDLHMKGSREVDQSRADVRQRLTERHKERELDRDRQRERERQESKSQKEAVTVEASKTLDALFRKTNTKPALYYLPLSEEEVARKTSEQDKARAERR